MNNYADYEYKTCPVCGIHYAVDKTVMDYKFNGASEKDRGWYCPNGHTLVFKEYTATRLQRELDNARQQIARAEDDARAAAAQRDREVKARKRMEKRIHAGVCPCCNRTFVNLQRHMATKHPDSKVVPLKVGKQ